MCIIVQGYFYLGILNFAILVLKGQGCLQYLTFNILAICWEFLDETYIFMFLIKLPF